MYARMRTTHTMCGTAASFTILHSGREPHRTTPAEIPEATLAHASASCELQDPVPKTPGSGTPSEHVNAAAAVGRTKHPVSERATVAITPCVEEDPLLTTPRSNNLTCQQVLHHLAMVGQPPAKKTTAKVGQQRGAVSLVQEEAVGKVQSRVRYLRPKRKAGEESKAYTIFLSCLGPPVLARS